MYQPVKNTNAVVTENIHKPGRNVMFLSADWCGDCRAIKPFIQNIKGTVSQTANWFDADRDDNLDVATAYNLRGIPSFVLFENGKEISRIGHGERLTPKQILDWYQRTLN
ncbi:thioredoxin family protein [Leuconostoc citreum]|uniref:thioredoxin family protein n=1 Tax=Leuconostoc citreum TaxID=33964 RepID=UPI00024662F8|nr:thioredoxin family protein [Leuconostoc citreum]MCS8587636.1 thioredoxin [Leuconostoc citreum]MCS8594460.1 thioredoxin [Leuconostoc citreum]MCS8599344.1 thioredoxin [Leuconostoc citreum]CCF23706.1 Thioredoxin family protein [Leuconostoc citreum LBAE C10]